MSTNWYADTFRKVLQVYHLSNDFKNVAGNLDAEGLARAHVDSHVQAVCISAKDATGNCVYETKIGRRHPNLQRDYLGELSAALKRHGLRVMVYFAPGCDQEVGLTHPEWQRFNERGEVLTDLPAGRMCLYSPYTDEVVIPQLQEITRQYDFDAFFLDGAFHEWFYELPCFCQFCREGFRRETGGEIPNSDQHPMAFRYRLWRNACSEAFMRKLTESVQKIKPEVMLCANFGYSSRHPVQPPDYVGFISMDPPTPSDGSYAIHFSIEGRYLSTVGVPFDCMNTRMISWGDWTLRPTIGLQMECAMALANGLRCFLSDFPYPDGTQEPAVFDAIRETYAFVKEREEYCKGATPVPYIAILHSAATLWSKTPLQPWKVWAGGPGQESVQGAHKALVESGYHFNILNSQKLAETLADYKVLILPDQMCLSSSEVNVIRRFVSDGGGLVASFQTSLKDEQNRARPAPALADLFGVEYQEIPPQSVGYIRPGEKVLAGSNIPNMPLLVEAPFALVVTTTAEKLGSLINPPEEIVPAVQAGQFWPGTPPPGNDSGYPALTLNRYGKGRVVYLSGEVFGAYRRTDSPNLKRLIARCVELVMPEDGKVITIDAPPSVEVSLFQQGKNKVVHLVNYHAEKRDIGTPNIEYLPVLSGIRVSLRSPEQPKRVIQIPEKEELPWETKDGVVSFTVPRLHIHSCFVVEY